MKAMNLTAKAFAVIVALAVLVGVPLTVYRAFASEPTPQERAASQLPDVLKEIERTQEYADRNAAARSSREQILACVNTGDCEGF